MAGKRKKALTKADVLRFAGLVAFLAICVAIVAFLWPYLSEAFTEGGAEALVARLQDAGVGGVFILLGLQLLQVIVAFIPGEVVQLAAGLMYGPVFGTIVIWAGCIVSSAIIFVLVRKLGAPFVQDMVSTEHLEKIRDFERSGKLTIAVFILFLIPAMPKDVLTYLVPLTDMRMRTFLITTNVARLPGIIASTYMAAGLADGDVVGPTVVLVLIVVVAIIVIVFRHQIMALLARDAVDERAIAKSLQAREAAEARLLTAGDSEPHRRHGRGND